MSKVVTREGTNLGEEGAELGDSPRVHRLRLPLLQHPQGLRQLLRVSLQRGGHQVSRYLIWFFLCRQRGSKILVEYYMVQYVRKGLLLEAKLIDPDVTPPSTFCKKVIG